VYSDLHIFAVYIWVTLRLCQAIDAHSGYGACFYSNQIFFSFAYGRVDFPWSLQHIFPLWSGADHHDFHHMAFVNNYSTSFRYLDFLFGTDNKYRAYKARLTTQAAGDASQKAHGDANGRTNTTGASDEWKQLVEAEVEREGVRAEAAAEQGGWGREANVGWAWWSRKGKTE
jgi:methylsterol monooxygenase